MTRSSGGGAEVTGALGYFSVVAKWSHFIAFFFVSGLQGTEPEEEEGKKCALTNGWASGLSLLE